MDSLTIRALNDNDYNDILVGWWSSWGWSAPPIDFLPGNGKGGIMVMDGDVPVCAGFMYLTNSKASWIDWIISNKSYTKRDERKAALKLLVDALTESSKAAGCKYAYALIKHKSLVNVYESCGYYKGDTYQSEMLKNL